MKNWTKDFGGTCLSGNGQWIRGSKWNGPSAALLFSAFLFSAIAIFLADNKIASSFPSTTLRLLKGQEALTVHVFDRETGKPLPARVVIRDEKSQVVQSYYRHLPGIFTDDKGFLEQPLIPGHYLLEIHHGIDYVSQNHAVDVRTGAGVEARIFLEPWIKLKSLGWINGEGHSHVDSTQPRNDSITETVRKICRAQGVDFICACQQWAGFNDANWREGFAKQSDENFLLSYGAEMPKYRSGHTFWFGLGSTRGYFDAAIDSTYETRYYQSVSMQEWNFDTLPFPSIPDVELVSRLKIAENAAAIIPHPTSWWWQKRGDIEKYVTNAAGYLAFNLLAGGLWDGMVVMGYDRDQYFYQNLWFHVLNQGYRLTPLAELDGGLTPEDRFYYGSKRTYFQAGPALQINNVVQAIKTGRTFVTSGPVVLASVDGRYSFGDEIPADGRSRTLRINALSSGEKDDNLSYLILFRNGRIHQLWDLRKSKPRKFEAQVTLRENENAWYVLKAYGRQTSLVPEQLDVMAICDRIVRGDKSALQFMDSDVCLTSPIYFRLQEKNFPAPLLSHLRLHLVDPHTGKAVQNVKIQVLLENRLIQTVRAEGGSVELRIPVHSILNLQAPGYPTLHRTLYLDYLPFRALLENLANGTWLNWYGGKKGLQPGQIPWEAFQFEKAKAVLTEVDWTLSLQLNERDPLWQSFNGLFEKKGWQYNIRGNQKAMRVGRRWDDH